MDCGACHTEIAQQYARSRHGKLLLDGDPNAPSCKECHGTHGIAGPPAEPPRPPSPPTSRTCARAATARARRRPCATRGRSTGSSRPTPRASTARACSKSGLTVTATCTNCHTAHGVLPRTDPASSVNRANVPATCGRCHHGIQEEFEKSVHHELLGKTDKELPVCNDCHSAHTIRRADADGFKLDIMQKCGRCHGEIAKTYFDTYHGKVSQLGYTKTAKCYDCHGAHDIQKVADPRSHLSRDNVVATCQKCHPGATRRFAGLPEPRHPPRPAEVPLALLDLLGHDRRSWSAPSSSAAPTPCSGCRAPSRCGGSCKAAEEAEERDGRGGGAAPAPAAGLRRSLRPRATAARGRGRTSAWKAASRRRPSVPALHAAQPDAARADDRQLHQPGPHRHDPQVLLHELGRRSCRAGSGGFESAGFIHRAAAVLMFGLFVDPPLRPQPQAPAGARRLVREAPLRPRLDAASTCGTSQEFVGSLKWFVGAGPRPRYGRWTYWEKFDYFAVFWGIFVIGSTGLMLWFPVLFTRVLPGLAHQRRHHHPLRRGAARHRLHLHGALLQHPPAAREVPDGHRGLHRAHAGGGVQARQAGGVRGAGGARASSRRTWSSPTSRS